jgi:hypothetical protein
MNTELKPVVNKGTNVAKLLTNIGIAKHLLLDQKYDIIVLLHKGAYWVPSSLLYTADVPTTDDSTTATFADDTVVLTAHENPATASHRLQLHLREIKLWL